MFNQNQSLGDWSIFLRSVPQKIGIFDQFWIIIIIMREDFVPYRSQRIRFLVLFLVSMVVFGNQYAFNNPQALELHMEEDLGIGQTQFQLLYTIFAFPNIFATFFLGFMIDFMGVRIGIITFSAAIAIFQLVIAIGGFTLSYTTILIGRMLFGLASDSLITAVACIISFWFKGKQLAFAMGLAVTFPELGNAFNSWLTPTIYELSGNLGTPLLVSVFVCLMSLGCAITVAFFDKKADNYDEQHKIKVIQSKEQKEQDEQIKCEDLKKLNGTFWLIAVICMFAIGLYVPFMDGANNLFVKRFCFTPVGAGKALVVTYMVAAICSPPLGYLIDKVGHKRYFIMLCMLIFTVGQFIFLVYPQCDEGDSHENGAIAGLVLIGLGYCFYGNCIMPAIPLVVQKKITGTAFGLMQTIESLSLSFFPLINGALIEHGSQDPNNPTGYRHSSLFFVMIGLLGMVSSVGLLFIPDKFKRRLDRISKDKMQVKHGENGQITFTATEADDSEGDEKKKQEIQITGSISNQNIIVGFLSKSEKKQLLEQL